MRLIAAALLALGLASSANAATGQTTDKTYGTMKAAATATAANTANRFTKLRNMIGHAVHASEMTMETKGIKRDGAVRTIGVLTPKNAIGNPIARIETKVLKVAKGWKGYTDTSAKPVYLR